MDTARLEQIGRDLLLAVGEDPDRDGLKETPHRWAAWWKEFIDYDPGKTDTTFEAINTGGLVVVSGIRTWSLCEHHLLPFSCDVTIGYLPKDRVLGLSKFARVAHQFAHRLQVQERMVRQIANEIALLSGTPNVIVAGMGDHLCGTIRGIKTPMRMKTVTPLGVFVGGQHSAALRSEFFKIAGW